MLRMTKNLKIAVYPGDGIGPEVTAEALRVLSRVQELDGSFKLDLTHLDRKSTRLNSSHIQKSRMPSSA